MQKIFRILTFLFFVFVLVSCTGKEKFTINFETNGGNQIDQLVIDATTTTIDLADPVKEGYTFGGWYFDLELTIPFAISGLLTNQTPTLYAKWTANEAEQFTISFMVNGGSAVSPIVGASGVTVTKPADPTKTGYTFIGWFSNVELTSTYIFSTMPSNNLTVYAKWEEVIVLYTITFQTNGGNSITAYKAASMTTIVKPTDPIKVGFTFSGWFNDAELLAPYVFSTMPAKDFTLYAKWTPITYTITFETNGGSTTSNIVAPYLSVITAPTPPTKAGYTFIGWFNESGLLMPYVFSTMPAKDFTLYAKWALITYTLSFESNGGSVVANISAPYLSTITAPTPPTKVGYQFDGWFSNVELTTAYTFSTMPLNGIKLYAKWKTALVNVDVLVYLETLTPYTFVLDKTEKVQALTNSTYTHTPITVSGFTFDSVHLSNKLTTTVSFDGTSTISVYYSRNLIEISYETNGGTPVVTQEGLYQANYTKPTTPTKAGYVFENWYKDQSLTTMFTDITYPIASTKLYAKWTLGQSTLKFSTVGGSSIVDLTQTTGSPITLPTTIKEGYNFIDWYESDAYLTVFSQNIMPAGITTLYAKWAIQSFSITYDEMGGSTVLDETHTYHQTIVEPTAPLKTNFVFTGWYLDQLYAQPFTFDVMPAQNITLYAKWVDASDSTSIIAQINQAHGSLVQITGVIYQTNASMFQGFYVFDDTASIYVNAPHTGIILNDEVTFQGYLKIEGDFVSIIDVTLLTVNSHGNTAKVPLNITFEDIDELSGYEKNLVGNLYQGESILVKEDNHFFMIDPLTFEGIEIFGASFLDDRVSQLTSLSMDRVTYTFVLVYEFGRYQLSIVEIEGQPYTEIEKISLIETLFLTYGLDPFYQEGSSFVIPTADPIGLVDVSYQAVGDNAVYYDDINHKFLDLDEDKIVDFEVTFTSPNDPLITNTITIHVLVKAIVSNSVSELLSGVTGEYYLLDVIVVSTSDMGMMILKDDTGLVYAQNLNLLQVGDRVLISAKRQIDSHQVMISSLNDGFELIEFISSGNELNLIPQTMTIEEMLALDETDPTIYGRYIELRGYLIPEDYEFHPFTKLVNGLHEIDISPYTHDGFEKLFEYHYLEIFMKGYIARDHDQLVLHFEGIREDITIPSYTDQELVDTIKQILVYMLEGQEYEAFEDFLLYPYHPTLGADVSWTLSPITLTYYDMETQSFTYSMEDVNINIVATITKGSASATFTLNSVLHKLEITEIETLIGHGKYGDYYIKGFIAYWCPDFSYIMDANGNMVLYEGFLEGIRKGDEVILGVSWNIDNNGAIFLNDKYEEHVVIEITSTDNPIVYTYQTHDMESLFELDFYDPNTFNKWIVIEGRLIDEGTNVILNTLMGSFRLDFPDQMTKYELVQLLGQDVRIKGIIHRYEDFNKELVINYLGLEGDALVVEYTDLEKSVQTKAYLLNHYQDPIVGNQTFQFWQAEFLFIGSGTITFTPLDDTNNILDVPNDFIHSVTETTLITVEVTTVYGSVTDTFNIIMTINPEVVIPMATVSEMILDTQNTYTLRGVVIADCDTIDNKHILFIKDSTGFIRIELDFLTYHRLADYSTHGYIGDTLNITGKAYNAGGYYQIAIVDVSVYQRNQTINQAFAEYQIVDILAMDPSNNGIYGIPVQIRGYVEMEVGINGANYYVNDGSNRILISMKNYSSNMLVNYLGYQVTLKGFILGANQMFETSDLTLVVNNYKYDLEPSVALYGYSDQEIVDMIAEQIEDIHVASNYLHLQNEYVWLPNMPSIFDVEDIDATLVYSVVSGAEHINFHGSYLVTKYATEDQVIIIKATITCHKVTQEVMLEIKLNGYVYNTLAELFEVEEGTKEIALNAEVLHSGFGYYYFLIENKVYYLETYMSYWANVGDLVTIIGKKSVVGGVADYTYELIFVSGDYIGTEVLADIISIETLYANDYDVNLYHQDYLSVYGKLGYDPYLDMYTLTDQGQTIYIRHESYSISPLEDYIDYYVYLDGYLPLGKLVRGEYMVFDFAGNYSDFRIAELSNQEQVDEIKILVGNKLDGMNILSGEKIGLPGGDSVYYASYSYTLVNPLDAQYVDLEHMFSNIVDSPKTIDILVSITSSDFLVTEDTTITITLSPRTDMTILDVYNTITKNFEVDVESNNYVQTKGVVTFIAYDNDDYDWIIIDDGSHALKVYLPYYELFDGENLSLAIGDEIRVVGIIGSDNWIVAYIETATAIKVIQTGLVVTNAAEAYEFEDIMDMDYLSLEHVMTYVKVNGRLVFDTYENEFVLESETYSIYENSETNFYHIVIESSIANAFYADMIGSNGVHIEVEGYLYLGYTGTYFDWYIVYLDHENMLVTP